MKFLPLTALCSLLLLAPACRRNCCPRPVVVQPACCPQGSTVYANKAYVNGNAGSGMMDQGMQDPMMMDNNRSMDMQEPMMEQAPMMGDNMGMMEDDESDDMGRPEARRPEGRDMGRPEPRHTDDRSMGRPEARRPVVERTERTERVERRDLK